MKKITKTQPIQPQNIQPLPTFHNNKNQQHIQKIFDSFDTQRTGLIAPIDLKKALIQLRQGAQSHPLYQYLCDLDTQGKQKIDIKQFTFLMTPQFTGEQTQQQLRKMFGMFDQQKTGFINIIGLRRLSNFYNLCLDQQDLQLMIRMADSDQDGFVSFQDFKTILKLNGKQ